MQLSCRIVYQKLKLHPFLCPIWHGWQSQHDSSWMLPVWVHLWQLAGDAEAGTDWDHTEHSPMAHTSVQQTMSQNSTDTGRTGSRFPWCLCFSHCSKDPYATGDFEPFAFSKKLLQQKMDLLLEGAHLTDGAWPGEVHNKWWFRWWNWIKVGRYKINLIKCDCLRLSLKSSAVDIRKRKGYWKAMLNPIAAEIFTLPEQHFSSSCPCSCPRQAPWEALVFTQAAFLLLQPK